MTITRISEFAHQVTRLGLMNCYLVREEDGFTLIDTTIAGGAKDILAAAQSLGGAIRRIVLTHAHGDHVGSVDALAAELPGVPVMISERSVPLLLQPPDKATRAGEPGNEIKGSLPGIKTAVSEFVVEGTKIGSLHPIHTPGHIPGHFAFLDERDGTLYAGDELVAVGKLALCGWTPWYFPLPTMAMWNRGLVVESARRLLDLPIKTFACGHGALRGGGVAALKAAFAETGQ